MQNTKEHSVEYRGTPCRIRRNTLQNSEEHSVEYRGTPCRKQRNTLQNTKEHPVEQEEHSVEYGGTPSGIRRNTRQNTKEHPVELTKNTLLRCSRIQPFILTLSPFLYLSPIYLHTFKSFLSLQQLAKSCLQWLNNSLAMFLANCLLNNFSAFNKVR